MAARPSSPGAAEVIRYHRRLDRTPEKQFHELPDTDKKLISQIRRATEKTVTSVGKLKDDIEEREKTIEEERSLRLAVEERLKGHLVDMYKSADVNSELRDRLPRANKTDILTSEMLPTREQSEQNGPARSQVTEAMDPTIMKHNHINGPPRSQVTEEMVDELAEQFARLDNRGDEAHEKKGEREAGPGEAVGARCRLDFNNATTTQLKGADIRRHSISDTSDLDPQRDPAGLRRQTHRPMHEPYNHPVSTNPVSSNPVLPPAPIYSDGLPVYSHVYEAQPGPASNLPFWRYMSSSSPVLYQSHDQLPPRVVRSLPVSVPFQPHLSHHRGFSSPLEKTITPDKTTMSSSNESGFVSTEEKDLSHQSARFPRPHALHSSATSDLGASMTNRFPATSEFQPMYMSFGGHDGHHGLHTNVPVQPPTATYSTQVKMRLSTELEAQRLLSEKLRESLTLAECKLKTIQLHSQQREAEARIQMTEKAAELVKQFRKAHRHGEDTILEQMRPADQTDEDVHSSLYFDASVYDRSEATSEQSAESDESDQDFNFLQTSSTNSSPRNSVSVDQVSCRLLSQIDKMLTEREFMKKDMTAVILSRDRAVAERRKMERELRQYRENVAGFREDQHALWVLQQERDAALRKVKHLEESMQHTQLAYSLQKSLSPEVIHNTLDAQKQKDKSRSSPMEGQEKERIWPPDGPLKDMSDLRHMNNQWRQENNQLLSQLQHVKMERDNLKMHLKTTMDNNKRLERQVIVLQRKLTESYDSK
ncbi:uncharacterized protein LOC124145331 [Haliotis rufescens]|uniref:uncharacterized protein LOC124145331 n=1 Tax=Haliotis rufescens TaxID=6454 RepID=UPI00201F0AB0|nr:uncharacterized protein LOC124145331 [Haliotis rufescens]